MEDLFFDTKYTIARTTRLEKITFEIQLAGEHWSGPIKYVIHALPISSVDEPKNIRARVFYGDDLIQSLDYLEWRQMKELTKYTVPRPMQK